MKNALILLISSVLAPIHLSGQTPTGALEGNVARHFNAETRCEGGKPVVKVSDHPNSQTEMHEQIHVRQMRVNCDSVWNVWLTQPEKRMRAEAQAECMALIHVGVEAPDRQKKMIELSRFWAQWWNAFDFGEYYRFYEEYCNLGVPTVVPVPLRSDGWPVH